MISQSTGHFTTINTKKFKTTLVKVGFRAELKRDTITSRILLSSVLAHACAQYPSKKALNAFLEELYGATLTASASKRGRAHTINFYMQVANEKYLKDSPALLETAIQTLGQMIKAPKLTGGVFDPEIVALESRLLKEDIESIYDNKTTYALKRLVATMCETETFGISGDGYVEDLSQITPASLYETYTEMLAHDEVSIVVLGDVDHTESLGLVQQYLDFDTANRSEVAVVDKEEKAFDLVATLSERQQVNQTKLNIGYRTGVRIGDQDYFALLVLNGIFGAFAHSKLFMNVREKHSLCYYCASQLDNFKGLMYVYSGLNIDQVDKATKIIDQQLDDIQNLNVTDKELDLAKKSIVNGKRESLDSAAGMLADLEVGLMLGMDADAFIAAIEAVTKEEVAAVAKKIKKDTVFLLKPEVEGESEVATQ